MKKLKVVSAFFVALLLNNTIKAQTSEVNPEVSSFEVFEAKLKQASPNPQILDARSAEEFKLNHIKGAVNIDVTNDAAFQQVADKLDKKCPVFVYSINNGRSVTVSKKLKAQNFSQTYVLNGGLSKWIGAGKPVETTVSNGLTSEQYKQLVQSEKLVLVDVHSKFCGGCKRLAPIVDSVAHENEGTLKVVKLELFDNKQIGKELNIESIPTLILYKDNKIVWQKSGFTSKDALNEVINHEVALK